MKERKTKEEMNGLENCDDTPTEMLESKNDQHGVTLDPNSVGTEIRSSGDSCTHGGHIWTSLSENLDGPFCPEEKGYTVGFTDLRNCGDFSTAMLASTFTQIGIIDYNGNISTQPDRHLQQNHPSSQEDRKNGHRGNHTDSFDDEFSD